MDGRGSVEERGISMRNVYRLALAMIIATSALLSSVAHAQRESPRPRLNVSVHLEDYGDVLFFREGQFAGTRGEGRQLEGFMIQFNPSFDGLSMQYMAHVQDVGDLWSSEGSFVGTTGQGRRVEGFAIQLTGPPAQLYDVWYMAHLQGFGDTGWFRNGAFCGTRGQARAVEGISVIVQRRF
jgi:uncharacterized protein YjdB